MSMNEAELIKELEVAVNAVLTAKLDQGMVHNIRNSLYNRYINDETGARLGLSELKMNLNVIIANILKEEEIASKNNSPLKVNKAENYDLIKKCLRVMEVIAKLKPDHETYNTFNKMDNNPLTSPPADQGVHKMTLALSSFAYIKSTTLYKSKSVKILIDEFLVDNSKITNLNEISQLLIVTSESQKERDLIVKSLEILQKLTSLERAIVEHNWTTQVNENKEKKALPKDKTIRSNNVVSKKKEDTKLRSQSPTESQVQQLPKATVPEVRHQNTAHPERAETVKSPIIFSRTRAKLDEKKKTEVTNSSTQAKTKPTPGSS